MATGGIFTLLPSLLLSLKRTYLSELPSLRCRPLLGNRMMLGSYRSKAQWTDRLLSSTLATMSSTAFQSSLLRMLPVLSDTLSGPREGASSSSSAADRSYQIKKGSKWWSGPEKKINGHELSFPKILELLIHQLVQQDQGGDRPAHAGGRWAERPWTRWMFTLVVQSSALTFLLVFSWKENTKSREILKE